MAQYQSEFRGVVNYYLLAYNVSHFGRLQSVMEMSLARAPCGKAQVHRTEDATPV